VEGTLPSGSSVFLEQGESMSSSRRLVMALAAVAATGAIVAVPAPVMAAPAAPRAASVAITSEVTGVTAKLAAMALGYVVVSGDTLSGIAGRYGTTWQAVWQENSFIADANLIFPGQKLAIPAAGSAPTAPAPAPAQPAAATSSGWYNPTPGACNISGFGPRWGTMHQGVDLAAGYGTPIHAATGGTVSVAYQAGGAGNYTTINHGGGVFTVYMHQSSYAVTSGWVNAGQVIGYVGQTGDAQGPHLHFEVHPNGLWNNRVDPVSFMANRGVYFC
jgi:murein DD-endopeptidase MepM/ murein hydrolase activator NlpD